MSFYNLPEESLHGSWVELNYSQQSGSRVLEHVPSSSSIHNGDMEKILLDAQHESERNSSRGSSHCDSPPLLMSPQVSHGPAEFETGSLGDSNSTQSDEEAQERSAELEKLLKNHAEWIWYCSSRPENVPPKEFLFKHPKYSSSLSVRKTSVMKKGGIFSSEFVVFLIPSLLITHLLMLGVGIYLLNGNTFQWLEECYFVKCLFKSCRDCTRWSLHRQKTGSFLRKYLVNVLL